MKAGDAWNHWYGISPTTWLDGWLRDNDWEEGDGRKSWEMGVISLGRLWSVGGKLPRGVVRSGKCVEGQRQGRGGCSKEESKA
jgi:hypothetical protein